MGENNSNVAWAGGCRAGGNLDSENEQKLRNLLDDFGAALENELNIREINILIFPIFREFNLVAGITKSKVIFITSPSASGLPFEIWMNWENEDNDLNVQTIIDMFKLQVGWTSPSYLQFPKNLLEMETTEKNKLLTEKAINWIDSFHTEMDRRKRIVRVNPIFKGRDYLIEEGLCFVLMPLKEPFFRLYEQVLSPTLGKRFRVLKADDIFKPTPIMDDIWEYINKSRFIVSDVTGKNPNVFYELGIAHTVGKEVIIITQNEDDIPFDIKHRRYIKYVDNEPGWENLKEKLNKFVDSLS